LEIKVVAVIAVDVVVVATDKAENKFVLM